MQNGTVRELINKLLDCDMDREIDVKYEGSIVGIEYDELHKKYIIITEETSLNEQ